MYNSQACWFATVSCLTYVQQSGMLVYTTSTLVQFNFKMVFTHLGKPFTVFGLSEVSPLLPVKQTQYLADHDIAHSETVPVFS